MYRNEQEQNNVSLVIENLTKRTKTTVYENGYKETENIEKTIQTPQMFSYQEYDENRCQSTKEYENHTQTPILNNSQYETQQQQEVQQQQQEVHQQQQQEVHQQQQQDPRESSHVEEYSPSRPEHVDSNNQVLHRKNEFDTKVSPMEYFRKNQLTFPPVITNLYENLHSKSLELYNRKEYKGTKIGSVEIAINQKKHDSDKTNGIRVLEEHTTNSEGFYRMQQAYAYFNDLVMVYHNEVIKCMMTNSNNARFCAYFSPAHVDFECSIFGMDMRQLMVLVFAKIFEDCINDEHIEYFWLTNTSTTLRINWDPDFSFTVIQRKKPNTYKRSYDNNTSRYEKDNNTTSEYRGGQNNRYGNYRGRGGYNRDYNKRGGDYRRESNEYKPYPKRN